MSDAPSNSATSITAVAPNAAARNRRLILLTYLLGILLYGLTCAPGVLWQDSAMFQHRVWFGDLHGESGLPLAHPLYIWLARGFTILFPLGDFAWRVNLFSAMCSAATLAVSMRLLLNVTRCAISSCIGVVTLAVSHTFWTHAAIAEVYNLYALGLMVELWCVERCLSTRQWRWLAWGVFACGLNLSNHLLALLHGPAYAMLVIWGLRNRILNWKRFAALVIAFLIGMLPYTALIVENIAGGQHVVEALKEAVVGPGERSSKVLEVGISLVRQGKRAAEYFAMNFPTPLALLIPFGIVFLEKLPNLRVFWWFLLLVFGVDFVFAFRYPVPDQFVFFTPCYVILALLIGIGAAWIVQSFKNSAVGIGMAALAFLPVGAYAMAPSMLRSLRIDLGIKRDIPYRDSARYFIQPWKCGENSAQGFGEEALKTAGPDGLLYADTTIKNVLVYLRDVEGIEQGVTLTTGHDTIPRQPRIDRTPEDVEPFVAAGRAFICTNVEAYVPKWMRERWRLEPEGIIFRIVPR